MLSEVNLRKTAVAKIDHRIGTETGCLSTLCVSLGRDSRDFELTCLRWILSWVLPKSLSTPLDPVNEVQYRQNHDLPTSADALKAGLPARTNVTVVPDHNFAIADQLPS